MTEQDVQKFSTIFSRAKSVMDRVDSSKTSHSQQTAPVQNRQQSQPAVSYAPTNNTQPELDYPEVTEHTDMAGRPINVQFEIPQNAYLNEEAYAQQPQYAPQPAQYMPQQRSGGYQMTGDVNITEADIQAARGKSILGPIIEDIARNPLNASNSAYDAHIGVSVIDRMGGMSEEIQRKMHEDAARLGYTQQPKQQTQPQQPVGYASSVDYALIKSIFEDQLKRYATSLKKSIIEESKQTSGSSDGVEYITIGKNSKNIKVVTAKGEIYEVSLKYVGKVND